MTLELSDKECEDCDLALLGQEEIRQYLPQLKLQWRVVRNQKMECEFKFGDFNEAMYFVNEVAALAEGENHHPDIAISFNKVKLSLSTHSVGGLSENDFIVASKVELL
jgi:4a-hydroxytetrahydrobiopterin dehydratase